MPTPPALCRCSRCQGGFSLLELLLVLAILGLLMAVALPSYRDYRLRANRSDAQISLSRLASLQERYFLRAHRYSANVADLLPGAEPGNSLASEQGHYQITLVVGEAGRGWSLQAIAVGAQVEDRHCVRFNLDHLGRRTASDAEGADNAQCW